jgi:hypothetical protein
MRVVGGKCSAASEFGFVFITNKLPWDKFCDTVSLLSLCLKVNFRSAHKTTQRR